MAIRGSGKIEIRESSEESDAGASDHDDNVVQEEEETLDQQEAYRRFRQAEKPTKIKTVSFPNEKKREMRRKMLVKRVTKKESSLKLVQKNNAMKLGFTKPDVVRDRVKERTLRRIATSGVAQLFNAVTERQKTLDVEIEKQKAGGKLKKEKLSATLNFGPPGVVKPKKDGKLTKLKTVSFPNKKKQDQVPRPSGVVKPKKEFNRLQKLIQETPFFRLVREIAQKIGPAKELRFQPAAIAALQEGSEMYLVKRFQDGDMSETAKTVGSLDGAVREWNEKKAVLDVKTELLKSKKDGVENKRKEREVFRKRHEEEKREIRKRLETLAGQIASVRAKCERLKSEEGAVKRSVTEARQKLTRLRNEKNTMVSELIAYTQLRMGLLQQLEENLENATTTTDLDVSVTTTQTMQLLD